MEPIDVNWREFVVGLDPRNIKGKLTNLLKCFTRGRVEWEVEPDIKIHSL